MRARRREPDPRHRVAKQLAVFGFVDGVGGSADHRDAELFEHAHLAQRQRGVERGLSAHGRQQRETARKNVPLLLDDLGDDLRRDRLDIGGVRQVWIGHDRRWIGIDQDDPIALVLERLAGLRAGIIELARLADDDRARADDQDRGDVGPLGHRFRMWGTKKSALFARRRRGSAPRAGVLDQIRSGGNASRLSCALPSVTLAATNMIAPGGNNADSP